MKSDELQGLRGVAVIAVVLYHLKIFFVGRGFLGVDVFFVLSGHFMASALHGKVVDFYKAIEFYKRRVKRLLPAFGLLLFLIVLAVPWFFILSEVDKVVDEIYHAMPFTINFKFAAETHNYWTKDQLFSSIVMHLWSLAVEMQFYLIVPFIFFFINRLDTHQHRIVAHSSLLAASLFLYCREPSESRQFNLLHNRLWEFVVGFLVQEIAVEITEDEKERWTERASKISLSSSVLLLLIMAGLERPTGDSIVLPFRLVTLLCTALVILCTGVSSNRLLSMSWLVYVGDISYVLYLIHWPVIVLVHAWVLTLSLSSSAIYVCLVVSLALSILVHHLFEKPLLTRSFNLCFAISMGFYTITLIALANKFPQNLADQIIHYRQGNNATLYKAMKWNHREAISCCNTRPADCIHDLEAEGWTGWKHEPTARCIARGNGTFSVLVVGNSVSMSSFETVYRSLDGRYRTLRLFAKGGCGLIAGVCDDYWHALKIIIERMKPDIILDTEYQGFMNRNPGDDSVLRIAQERVDFMRSHSKALMVDQHYLLPLTLFPSFGLSHYLARGWTKMDRATSTLERMRFVKRAAIDRINALQGDNLIINNITTVLCERIEGICEGYNPVTLKAYTQTGVHINSYGYELLEPIYRKSIDRVIEIASRS